MGFKNLMSSWRVRIFFSKLPYVRVFLKNHAKSMDFRWSGSSIFFILYEYIDKLYTYIKMLQKVFANSLMGFKIVCQVEDFVYFFKITLCTCVFKNHAKIIGFQVVI